MRAALYFSPPEDHPLSGAAAGWLGRDAWRAGRAFADAGEDALVAEPRRYGFHATLKPPFRLAAGTSLAGLRDAMAEFCRVREGAVIAALRLARIGAFFALVPGDEKPGLDALAAAVVRHFEPFRASATEAEIARRRPERLTERQRAYLAEWGYPYVFDAFQFHMTLTGPVAEEERGGVEHVLRTRFAAFLGRPLAVDTLCLFVEPSPPGNFVIDTALPLAGPAT